MADVTQTIQSDAFIGVESTQNILSSGHILAFIEQIIDSDGFVGQETIQTLSSDAITLVTQTETITSSAFITPVFIFSSQSDLTVIEEEELLVETEVDNPIPAAPTSLVAADIGVGDSIALNWSSPATFFNIYRKELGPIFTKLNQIPIEDTAFQAGGLPQNTAITFIVRAVNGLGQESTDSNEALATPTLNITASRFTNPTWVVTIGGIPQTDAILTNVTLSFGSRFSTAIFSLPVDPRSGSPTIGSLVTVVVNGRLIFNGKIRIRADVIDVGGGLRVRYTCYSNIVDQTTITIFATDVDMISTTFNIFQKLPDGKGEILNEKTAAEILAPQSISGVPSIFPGTVDITDLTPLAAMELVLQKLGNYKVYHNMSDGANFAYRFGSGGFNTRSFTFGDSGSGGNILSYDISRSDISVVKKIDVIGSPTQVRIKKTLSNLDIGIDKDGRRRLLASLTGKNIRDIQVFGFARAKPTVKFNENVQVLLEDLTEAQSDSAIDNSFSLSDDAGGSSTGDENTAEQDKSFRPIVVSIGRFSSLRQAVGARITYGGKDKVEISINKVPKKWFATTRSGNVEKVKIGLEGEGTKSVKVLLSYGWFPGTMEVEYTIDIEKPLVTAGNGTPSKSITDGQFQIINDPINGFDNEADILTRMNARAINELARLQKEEQSGSITVRGDETLDLRSSVSVNGSLLEISGVSHSFVGGFTSTVELTNEPFFSTIIIPPSLVTRGKPREREKSRRIFLETYVNRALAEADNSKYLAAQKEEADRDTTERGPFAIYQD